MDPNLRQNGEQLRDDAAQLREDIAQLRDDVAQLTQDLRDVAAARGAEGVEAIRRTAHQTRDQARALAEDLERRITERPLTNILIAFGAGFVVGRLLDRR